MARFNVEIMDEKGKVIDKREITAETLRNAVNDVLAPTFSDLWRNGSAISITATNKPHHTDAQTR